MAMQRFERQSRIPPSWRVGATVAAIVFLVAGGLLEYFGYKWSKSILGIVAFWGIAVAIYFVYLRAK